MKEHQLEITVPFHDIDIMDVAWHGHYIKYFEIARLGLMSKVGLDWPELRKAGYALPIVGLEVKYRRPLKYGEVYIVKAQLEECEHAELVLRYEVLGQKSLKTHAHGRTRQAYTNAKDASICLSVPDFILVQMRSHGWL